MICRCAIGGSFLQLADVKDTEAGLGSGAMDSSTGYARVLEVSKECRGVEAAVECRGVEAAVEEVSAESTSGRTSKQGPLRTLFLQQVAQMLRKCFK